MPDFKYTIGYIDEDSTQVEKYAWRLEEYGIKVVDYDMYEGITLDELLEQVYRSDIDLLMIDYKLTESNIVTFNGNEVADAFYEMRPQFPHIIFTNKVPEAELQVRDWNIIFNKSEVFDKRKPENAKRFVTILERNIDQYKGSVKKVKDRLAVLLEKGAKEGISVPEQDEVLKLQEKLQNWDQSQKAEVPRQLTSSESLEDISKVRKEAENFLKTLLDEEGEDESKK